jgi:hypothetical protein
MCLIHDECGEARFANPITFRCATCGEAYARRGDLLAHLRQSGHGYSPERDRARPPDVCSACASASAWQRLSTGCDGQWHSPALPTRRGSVLPRVPPVWP